MVKVKTTKIGDFVIDEGLEKFNRISEEKRELLIAAFIAATNEVGDDYLRVGCISSKKDETVAERDLRVIHELAIAVDDYMHEAKYSGTKELVYIYDQRDGDKRNLMMGINIKPRSRSYNDIADALLEGFRKISPNRPRNVKEALQLIQ